MGRAPTLALSSCDRHVVPNVSFTYVNRLGACVINEGVVKEKLTSQRQLTAASLSKPKVLTFPEDLA